jgi:uncharacterized protein
LNVEELLNLLACPKCHAELRRVDGPTGLVCQPCKLFFALDDGLPNLLISDARAWPLATSPASA